MKPEREAHDSYRALCEAALREWAHLYFDGHSDLDRARVEIMFLVI